jgi:hypothetical protein
MNNIKTIPFKNKLFRANKDLFNNNGKLIYKANINKNILASTNYKNILASVNYKNANMKYFTLNRSETNAYTKEGTTYVKNWDVIEDLDLVDILDLSTRRALEDKFKSNTIFTNAINSAFPVINNKVHRISSSTNEDNKILEKICELGYDGYYMESKGSFHSEVGLCKRAFRKLKLLNKPERKYAPQKTRKRTRAEYEEQAKLNENNNNNENNYYSHRKRRPSPNTLKNIPKFSLFN